MTREPGSIIIPAATLAEFIARAVESYGSIRSAAEGIGVPRSTLRGWMLRRFLTEPNPERSGDELLEHLAGQRDAAALRAHLNRSGACPAATDA